MRARPAQIPIWRSLLPDPPETWLVVGGRGAGKTLLGAEWVNGLVRGFPPYSRRPKYGNIALVGETLADVREVMIDGPSGIRTISRGTRPRFEATRRRLVWDNGAVAQTFSSEDPESLRGPQFDAAWCDDFAKWKNLQATWDMLQFGLRLGDPLQLQPIVVREKFGADQTIEEVMHRVTIRHRPDVASGMRFVLGDRILAILTVHDPDETGRYLVCRTKEQGR